MSQYPPYQPPTMQYGYGSYIPDPLGTLLAPAKRASIFMFIIGGLLIPCGGLVGALSFVDYSTLGGGAQAAQFQMLEQQMAQLGWTIAGMFQVIALVIGIPGILYIILGVMIRGGGMGSVICSIILNALLSLVIGYIVLAGLLQSGARPDMLIGVCVWAIPLALLIVALVFSIQAVKNCGYISAMRYQMMTGQQLQQPPYGQPGFGPPAPGQQQWGQQQWGQSQWPAQQPPQPPPGQWPPQG